MTFEAYLIVNQNICYCKLLRNCIRNGCMGITKPPPMSVVNTIFLTNLKSIIQESFL